MKKIISLLIVIAMAVALVVSVGAYGLPTEFFREDGGNNYSVTTLHVELMPGYCDIYEELDYDSLFEGAEYSSINDDDDMFRTLYPNKDKYPPDYDPATHVRILNVVLYDDPSAVDWSDEEACVARLEKAIRDFENEKYDFVNRVYVGFLAGPCGVNDEWKNNDINGDGKLNARDVTVLMKGIVDKSAESDVNGDGKINARDVTTLMKAIMG